MNPTIDCNETFEIWLLEDDYRQFETLQRHFLRFPQRISPKQLVRLSTESEFLARVHRAFVEESVSIPRMVIMDVMLPWARLGEEPEGVKQPDEVKTKYGFTTAGVRCWAALREAEKKVGAPKTPVVFHTVIRKEEIGYPAKFEDGKTGYVSKEQPFDQLDAVISGLDEKWDEMNWPETDEQVTENFVNNARMKRILLEGLATPIDDCVPFPA